MKQRFEAQQAEMQGSSRANIPNQAPPPAPPVPQPAVNHASLASANPDLYEGFRHMKGIYFAGSSDPLVANEWLAQIQVILNFMNNYDEDKVKCESFV